jgi:hypothetical protein
MDFQRRIQNLLNSADVVDRVFFAFFLSGLIKAENLTNHIQWFRCLWCLFLCCAWFYLYALFYLDTPLRVQFAMVVSGTLGRYLRTAAFLPADQREASLNHLALELGRALSDVPIFGWFGEALLLE